MFILPYTFILALKKLLVPWGTETHKQHFKTREEGQCFRVFGVWGFRIGMDVPGLLGESGKGSQRRWQWRWHVERGLEAWVLQTGRGERAGILGRGTGESQRVNARRLLANVGHSVTAACGVSQSWGTAEATCTLQPTGSAFRETHAHVHQETCMGMFLAECL